MVEAKVAVFAKSLFNTCRARRAGMNYARSDSIWFECLLVNRRCWKAGGDSRARTCTVTKRKR